MPEETNPENPNIDPLTVGDIITIPEAAQISGFSPKFLARLAASGKLKAKKSGSAWLTTAAAIEEYKANRSFKNIPKKYRDRT